MKEKIKKGSWVTILGEPKVPHKVKQVGTEWSSEEVIIKDSILGGDQCYQLDELKLLKGEKPEIEKVRLGCYTVVRINGLILCTNGDDEMVLTKKQTEKLQGLLNG